jgi:hypothetical protein
MTRRDCKMRSLSIPNDHPLPFVAFQLGRDHREHANNVGRDGASEHAAHQGHVEYRRADLLNAVPRQRGFGEAEEFPGEPEIEASPVPIIEPRYGLGGQDGGG